MRQAVLKPDAIAYTMESPPYTHWWCPNSLQDHGAGSRARTCTALRPADFKSAASARSAIPARCCRADRALLVLLARRRRRVPAGARVARGRKEARGGDVARADRGDLDGAA